MTSYLNKGVVSFAFMERLREKQGLVAQGPIEVHENWQQVGKFFGYLLAIGAVSVGGVLEAFNNPSPSAELTPITSAASYQSRQLSPADVQTIS